MAARGEEHLRGITVAESRRLFVEEGRREPNSTFRARVDAFARLLAGRRERRLAAFAHADFFHELLARHFGRREPQYQDLGARAGVSQSAEERGWPSGGRQERRIGSF